MSNGKLGIEEDTKRGSRERLLALRTNHTGVVGQSSNLEEGLCSKSLEEVTVMVRGILLRPISLEFRCALFR